MNDPLRLTRRPPSNRLNEQVKRNLARLPDELASELTPAGKAEVVANGDHLRGLKFSPVLPCAFTEPGAVMPANALNSAQAGRRSVFVVRAFVKMRVLLGGTKQLARRLRALGAKLTARFDGHEAAIADVLQRLMRLLDAPPEPEPHWRTVWTQGLKRITSALECQEIADN